VSAKVPVPNEPLSRSTMETPEQPLRHHPFFYIGGIFLNAVVFLAVGPLIGGVILATVTSMFMMKFSIAVLFGYIALFFVTVPTSYFIASPTAVVTGTIVAIASIWITSNRSLYMIAACAGGVVSMLLLSRSEFLMRDQGLASSLISFAVSGAIAALVCTRLATPFRLSVLPGPSLPEQLMAKSK
jgi:hypothetical protein